MNEEPLGMSSCSGLPGQLGQHCNLLNHPLMEHHSATFWVQGTRKKQFGRLYPPMFEGQVDKLHMAGDIN